MCRKLKLSEDFDYQQLARLTPGYVGADLMALCREAAMSAVNRVLLKAQPRGREQRSSEELRTSSAQDEAQADVTDKEVQLETTELNPQHQGDPEQQHLQV